MSEPHRVAVVGGGLAGLAAAYGLSRRARSEALEVTLFEAGPGVGGRLSTRTVDVLRNFKSAYRARNQKPAA